MDEFLEKATYVLNNKDKSEFKEFFEKIDNTITTKSDMILEKLKSFKEVFIKLGDKKNEEEIDWLNLLTKDL